MKDTTLKILTVLLMLFALLTLFLSGSVIFDLFGIRAKEGNYVLLVVWANFISSILYLAAAYGLFKIRKWPVGLLALSAVLLVAAFVGLKMHISEGGLYEAKTLKAMIFRISITILFAVTFYFLLKNNKLSKNEKI